MNRFVLFISLLVASWMSCAQVTVSPAAPKEQETVRVQIPQGVIGSSPYVYNDTYTGYDPLATRVSMVNNKVTISVQLVNLDFSGKVPSAALDLPIGQLPAGSYLVEVVRRLADGTSAGSVGSANFIVAARASNAPLWNHTDIWWNPGESGWGLNVVQHGSGVIFATWFVYGADGKPAWYVMPTGEWANPGAYQGIVYRTTGPAFDAPFNPAVVTSTPVGSLVLNFNVFNANILDAAITIDGKTTFKRLQRQSF